MSHEKVAIRMPGFMRSIGRGIGGAGRSLKRNLWDFPHGDPSRFGDPRAAAEADYGNEMYRATAKTLGGLGAGLGAAGLGTAYVGGAFDDDEAGDQPGLADRITEGAGELGDRAVTGINRAGEAVTGLFDEEGAIGGMFQEGGALGGVGDWWRGLDPQTRQAIIYSAIAGGAGLGGYGLYRMLGGGGGQQQPAYY